MDQRIIVALLATGMIGFAAARFVPGRAAPHVVRPAPRDESAATIDALRAEVDALRRELRVNAAGVSALQAETGRLSDAVAAASAQPNVDASGAEEAERPPSHDLNSPERAAWVAARKTMIATTEANFQAEVRNGAWSSEKTSALREKAGGLGAISGALRSVDCRSRTCRVEMTDDEATKDQLHRFVRDCGLVFPKIVADHVADTHGNASYVFYMTDAA